MNINGTFYEKPREGGLAKIKPLASHRKQIMDFCTWRGLLVISGTRMWLMCSEPCDPLCSGFSYLSLRSYPGLADITRSPERGAVRRCAI